MRVKLLFTFAIASALAIACNNSTNLTVKLNDIQPDTTFVNTSKLKYSFIQLQTDEDHYIQYVIKCHIDWDQNKLFLLDEKTISIYSTEGEFIYKIPVGKGPNEVNGLIGSAIDKKNKCLYALDNSNSLVQIDYNGNITQRTKLVKYSFFDLTVKDDSHLLMMSN